MTPFNPDIEDYKLLIYKVASSFHRTTGLDYDDLIAQGNLLFCKARQAYQPNRNVKFSTFLYRYLINGLNLYVKEQRKHYKNRRYKEDSDKHPWTQLPYAKLEKTITLRYNLSLLSKEAQVVVSAIINSPLEIWELLDLKKPFAMKKKLYNELRVNGWHQYTIRRVFNEIKLFLSEV